MTGQAQSELPGFPAQGFPAGQTDVGAETRQAWAFREQVTTDVGDAQKVPMVFPHILGAVGQLQLAFGKSPVQGVSDGQAIGAASEMHPWAS